MHWMSIAYWAASGLFCLVLAFSGVTQLFRVGLMVDSMLALGDPISRALRPATILLPGVVAYPPRPAPRRLRELPFGGLSELPFGAPRIT